MSCENPPCDDTENVKSGDLPLWTGATLPEDGKVILLTDKPDYDNGGKVNVAYRLPLDRITPTGAPQSVAYSLVDPDAGITIPDNTVVPAYVESFGDFNLKRAIATDATTKARFLITSLNQNIDGAYFIQGNGFLTFSEPHEYVPGTIYYLSASAPGGVTDTPPVGIAQPLFYVIDQRTILINIGE